MYKIHMDTYTQGCAHRVDTTKYTLSECDLHYLKGIYVKLLVLKTYPLTIKQSQYQRSIVFPKGPLCHVQVGFQTHCFYNLSLLDVNK